MAEGASGQGDPTGARAAALQQAVATAAAQGGGTLALDGVYNFSVYGDSLEIVGGAVKLVGNGATLLFRGAGALPNGRTILPGVNFTNCVNAGLSGVAIDYVPKPIGLNCNFRTNSWLPPTPGCKQSGVGAWQPGPCPVIPRVSPLFPAAEPDVHELPCLPTISTDHGIGSCRDHTPLLQLHRHAG